MKSKFIILSLLFFSTIAGAQFDQDTLLVGYTSAPPFLIKAEDRSWSGIDIHLWKHVAKDLALKYKLVEMNFTDMLSALERGEIDVCINPLTITSERSKRFDFTYSFFATNSTIAVQKDDAFAKFIQLLKSFFTINFLSGFLVLLLIIGIFGVVTWLFEKRLNAHQFRPGWIGIWDGLWWSVVTVTTVGYGDKVPKSRGGKIVALIWMFFGLLFISGLTASVASRLTVNKLNEHPDGISTYKNKVVGSIENTETLDFLKTNFFKQVDTYDNVFDGLTALNARKIEAFLYDEPILRYRMGQHEEFDELQILPIKFDLQFYAFGIAKDKKALGDSISQEILEYIETAEWQILLNEYGLSEI